MAEISASFPTLQSTPVLKFESPALFANRNPLGTGLLNLRPSVNPTRPRLSLQSNALSGSSEAAQIGTALSGSAANPYSMTLSSPSRSNPYAQMVS